MMKKFCLLFLLFVLGCQTEVPTATVATATLAVATAAAAVVPTSTVVMTATAVPPPPALPTAIPTSTAVPSPTPDLLLPFTLEGLRQRDYPGGAIEYWATMAETADFTQYYVAYPSDELTITGMMHVPTGAGPFPVIVLLHGYYERDQYYAGADTWQTAEFFAREGYLTIAPDYRSWGASDVGLSLFHTGLVVDVLNLLSALDSVPQADTTRIGLWGHSMGGGMTTKILVVDDRVQAAVLYAPNSADDGDLIGRWGPGCLPGQSLEAEDRCNPGEMIPVGTDEALLEMYFAAAADPAALQRVAPYYHLDAISVPVQIHIGTADGAILTQTPPEWSAKLYEGLLAAGKEVMFFEYEGAGHYFEGADWSLFHDRALAFFDEQLNQ
ncbi:MAG: alpha/beta fold hydrolase [Ardenticatenaceae bacterium]|nr:alpha/beta fold hydrolase [Ardenticatenaceae bacterium]